MVKRQSLSLKLTYFFIALVLSVLLATGISTFMTHSSAYMKQNEQRLMNIVDYLTRLMEMDGVEFVYYQAAMLEYSDEILIPYDFDGDYHPAKVAFYNAFDEIYNTKALGTDVTYDEMSKELKILYGTYKHEYWLHVFETARDSFGIDYCYYTVPTGEDLNVYYMIDALREKRVVDGNDYILLNLEIDQPLSSHQHMWDAWNSGEYVPGFDMTNNEFGVNCGYFYPLIINGEKYGIVGADVSYEKINKAIVSDTLKHIVSIGIVVFIICAILSWTIGAKYVSRLLKLKDEISEFSETKNPDISYRLVQDVKGDDEIYDLAKQTSIMISEIGSYMKNLENKNKELTEAQKRIKEANELANRDALTGIRNKTAYENEILKIENKIISDRFREFGIAMVDLNNLKVINDSFGHEKGDVAIKKICGMVCRKFSHSPVFRIGGDEFVVMIQNDDYYKAEILVRELRHEIEETSSKESLEPWERISAAIGWTLFDPDNDNSVECVFKRADGLMYENKKQMKAGMS